MIHGGGDGWEEEVDEGQLMLREVVVGEGWRERWAADP
jgi:hypothetical protein